MDDKKVFVTGANGMLGSAICHLLREKGYGVKAFCFPDSQTKTIEGIGAEICFGDVLDKAALAKEMEGCQHVVHVAALTSMWPKRNKKVISVNLIGTENVATVAEQLGAKRMVYISSASSFQFGTKEMPGTEETIFDGWSQQLDYIDSKYLAQEMLIERHTKNGLPVIVINPTFMIGPYDTLPSSGKVLIGLYKNEVPGYSKGGKNFVYSVDVATAAINALEKGRLGQCYIAGNQNLSYREFFEMASNIMGKKFKLVGMPNWIILSIGKINSIVAAITNKPPKLSYELAKISIKYHGFSAKKAVTELDMPQTPLPVAIEKSLKWFQENGYL